MQIKTRGVGAIHGGRPPYSLIGDSLMGRFSLIIFTLGLSLFLSSCSSPSISAKSDQDFSLIIPSSSSTGCSEEDVDKVVCFFPYEITNLADTPKSLSGNFFALVEGKIYLAESSSDRRNSLTDTWNPGDKKSGNIFFSLPSESDISSIFFGPQGTSSIEDAVLIVPVNVTAIDPQTKKRKDCESTFKKMNEMVSRWREASEYPWVVGSPSCYELENVYFLATISPATGAKYPEGGELPQCLGSVVAKTQIANLYVVAKKYDYAVFEDSVSGFGIVTVKSGLDSEFCSYELGKIPSLRVLY
jgi:hypothetical protein